jgi:hypothetical protein
MSKGIKAKEHRKKVEKRNERIRQERKKADKSRQEFLMKLIEEEKQRGLFNSPVMPIPGSDAGFIGMPNLGIPNGPQI